MGRTLSSRRQFLGKGGAVAVAVAAAAPALRSAQPAAGTGPQVSFAMTGDAGFAAALDRLFPGLSKDHIFTDIAPLTGIITLASGPAVRAFSVGWSIESPSGTFRAAQYFFAKPGASPRGKSGWAAMSAKRDLLRPGESRLVSPFFSWTPRFYAQLGQPNWSAILQQGTPGAYLLARLPVATSVSLGLDAVAFADRTLAGPDTLNLRKRLREVRNAEHDESKLALKQFARSPDLNDLAGFLITRGSSVRPRLSTAVDGTQFWGPQLGKWQSEMRYAAARRRHAQRLLKLMQMTTADQFRAALTGLARMRPTRHRRIAMAISGRQV